VAVKFGISRRDQDLFALRSQQRAAAAQARGFHAAEIVPVEIAGRRPEEKFAVLLDEHPRPSTTIGDLERLPPLFCETGNVTAGNSSGINDGAAAMIIASGAAARAFDLKPRARILGMAAAGIEPGIMGIGPVPAMQKLSTRLKLPTSAFDAIEINEAFASQCVAVLRLLGIDEAAAHVNANGGAIALGHPLGMSGARILITLLNQLEVSGGKRGLAALCVGVGMGLALAIERI
jgi:3-oxoadipyl-CoA thiolase